MVPHISPSKTWEGFGGALAFSLLAELRAARAHANVKLGRSALVDLLVLGLGLSVGAVIGDLAESILKRSTGVKDSGPDAARASAGCSTSSTACSSRRR